MAALARNALLHANEVAMREQDHGIWQEMDLAQPVDRRAGLAAALEAPGFGAGSAR